MDSEASPAGLVLPGVSGKQGKVEGVRKGPAQLGWSLGSRLGL